MWGRAYAHYICMYVCQLVGKSSTEGWGQMTMGHSRGVALMESISVYSCFLSQSQSQRQRQSEITFSRPTCAVQPDECVEYVEKMCSSLTHDRWQRGQTHVCSTDKCGSGRRDKSVGAVNSVIKAPRS